MSTFELQINPTKYSSLFNGWKTIYQENKFSGLFNGWVPTCIGYSLQGAFKFGFYEFFKKEYSDKLDPSTFDKYKTLVYLSASASAELIADVALCPFEATKVRMQTSDTIFKSSFDCFKSILTNEGFNGFYKGIVPLWMRQVPYTMMKFAAFERTVESIYKYLLSRPKSEYNKVQQLGVTFVAGYWAGIFCAVVSHPADTLVSKLNNVKKTGSSLSAMQMVKDLGFWGLWRGLGTRIIMIGTLTALQWFIYDTFKVYSGLPTSGNVTKK